MDSRKTNRDIADEVANDKHFQDCRLNRGKLDVSQIAMPRNTQATSSGMLSSGSIPEGHLLGRVQLALGSSGTDTTNLYIGPGRARLEELGFKEEEDAAWEVFSWAAPLASVFFSGHYSGNGIDVSAGVIRTIHGLGTSNVAVDDDSLLPPIEPVFPARQLNISAPPVSATRAPQSLRPGFKEDGGSGGAGTATSPLPPQPPKPPRNLVAAEGSDDAENKDGIRGRNVLNIVMQAPRKEQLDAQIATLQSRQYDLISRPASESQLVQGNPGTGKTIVAAHRVAYLLDPEAEDNALSKGKVLLVGPSVAYTNHVRKILLDLVPVDHRDRYVLTSIEEVFRNLLGDIPIESFKPNQAPHDHLSFDQLVFEIANCAAENFKEDYEERFLTSLSGSAKKGAVVVPLRELSPTKRAERCYEYFRVRENARLVLDEVIRASIHDAEATPEEIDETVEHRMLTWLPWVESLPPFDSLSNQPDQQWLIALMSWNLDLENETSIFQGIEHVIVDEAQDLYPVEWSFLRSINLTGSWTVVGDFNQQSAVHGFKSWKMIGKQLEVASPPQILALGYRSTSGIMALANATIGSTASAGQSIQISTELPIAKRVPKVSELPLEIENWADRFAEKFPGGITALIVAPKHVDAVRKVLALRHWWAEGDQLHWRHPGREWTQENALTIGTPQELRGLEYDAVILLEPADIPTKQQRFMAISRANRELVVLHAAKALPPEMHKFLRPPWE